MSEPVGPFPRFRRSGVTPLQPKTSEMLELGKRLVEEHYQRWIVEPIPGVRKPHAGEAASRRGKPRKSLERLLSEIEQIEAAGPRAERFAVAKLRPELGLP